MAPVLGIDLGGTKVLAGVVDTETGKVLGTTKKRSRAEHGQADLIQRLEEAATGALEKSGVSLKSIERIGVGVAGQIDREKGMVLNAPNLASMANVALASKIEKKFGASTYLFNDVEAAAAGEASFGAARNHTDFVVVFVGTGIGGSIYRKSEPYVGATHTAGELGHMIISVNGRLCGCGGFGHLEAYASRTAIVRSILAGLRSGRESSLSAILTEINPQDPGGSGIRSKALKQAVDAGDPLTNEVLTVAADHLAAGLASIINFYNPPLIVLGGGLIEAVDLFFDEVESRTRNASLQVPRQHVEIVKSGLGDFSGIVGAAVLAEKVLSKA